MTAKAKRYKVLLTRGAERDLESIYDYTAEFDSVTNANHVLDKLMAAAQGVALFPERGSYPKELLALGIKEYRQVSFKPHRAICRAIYRVMDKRVIFYLIVDGRRDMPTVLAERLLGASQ
jgi:toxin ParE1/3/4